MQQGAVTLDDSGTILFCNRQFPAMMKVPAERLLGTTLANHVCDADRPGFAALLRGIQTGVSQGEVGLMTGDGGLLPVYLHLSALPLTGGTAFCVVVTDLTERKEHEALAEAKRLLADSEARLRVTLASIGDAVIVTDAQGRVTFMNAVAEDLTGWTRQDAVGNDLAEVFRIVNEQTGQTVESSVAKVIREGTIVGLANHTILIGRDGNHRPIDDSGTPIRDATNEIVGVVLVFRDVTERRRAEQALHHSEQTARFLAQASADLVELTDPESTLQKLASAAVPQFADWCTVDLLDGDAVVRRVAVRHADPARAEVAEELKERYLPRPMDPHGVANVVRTGAAELVEDIPDTLLAALAHDDEHLRLLLELGLRSYLCVPMRSKGTTLGVLTFMTAESGRRYNATDLHAAEDLARRAAVAIENANLYRTLRESDRRKDEFLATLAHELRNPLAPIRNGLQILRLAGNGEEAAGVRDMMERQMHQMVRLVDDLLDVSRITRGLVELRRERLDLSLVVETALESCRPLVEAAHHDLTVMVPSGTRVGKRGLDPPRPGAAEPAQQRRQVHARGRSHLVDRGAGRRRGGHPGTGQWHRHPQGHAAPHLRHVHPGGPHVGPGAGRPGDRADPGATVGGDARRQRRSSSDGPGRGSDVYGAPADLPWRTEALENRRAAGQRAESTWAEGRRILVVDDNVDSGREPGAAPATDGQRGPHCP